MSAQTRQRPGVGNRGAVQITGQAITDQDTTPRRGIEVDEVAAAVALLADVIPDELHAATFHAIRRAWRPSPHLRCALLAGWTS